jgi:AdoMet-dependent heme synthase
VFIAHRGDVFPSGFLPLSGGNVRDRSVVDIYQNAPLFRDLRNPQSMAGIAAAASSARSAAAPGRGPLP